MNKKYSEYNIIPIGDHCAITIALRDLKLRNKSYPFDWVCKEDHLYDTNIIYNINLIKELDTEPIETIVKNYIGDAFDNDKKINQTSRIWFPHDNKLDSFEKYERRFNRLKEDLNKKNMFFLLTRHYYINEDIFQDIIDTLLKYNKDSMICFISGTDHLYFTNEKYKGQVIFKYIHYDITKFYHYDNMPFRPKILNFLLELLF